MTAAVLMVAAAVATIAVLVRTGRRIATSVLSGINVAGAVGLASVAVELAIYDGVAVFEFSLCIGLIVALISVTFGGLALERRGKFVGAVLVLLVGTAPIIVALLVLLELHVHPIRWN